MVKAKQDIPLSKELQKKYNKKRFGIGEELPKELAVEYEINSPQLLDSYETVNSTYVKIVKKIKPKIVSPKPLTEEEPKPKKEELVSKAKRLGFAKFRKWANNKFKVTGRSIDGIIKDILSGKREL